MWVGRVRSRTLMRVGGCKRRWCVWVAASACRRLRARVGSDVYERGRGREATNAGGSRAAAGEAVCWRPRAYVWVAANASGWSAGTGLDCLCEVVGVWESCIGTAVNVLRVWVGDALQRRKGTAASVGRGQLRVGVANAHTCMDPRRAVIV